MPLASSRRIVHRLYQVEGVWHMSGDDDGVMSFQYIAESRMKLDKDVADAMGEGPSYLPTVREAFDHLVRWVEKGTPRSAESDRQARTVVCDASSPP